MYDAKLGMDPTEKVVDEWCTKTATSNGVPKDCM